MDGIVAYRQNLNRLSLEFPRGTNNNVDAILRQITTAAWP
jgi:hypothetical protein